MTTDPEHPEISTSAGSSSVKIWGPRSKPRISLTVAERTSQEDLDSLLDRAG